MRTYRNIGNERERLLPFLLFLSYTRGKFIKFFKSIKFIKCGIA